MSDLAKDIVNVLEQMEDVKLRDLKDAVSGIALNPDGRRIRRAIEQLRAAGEPIGSSARRGYFIIRTKKDFDDAIKEFRAKAMACLKMKAQLERIGTKLFTKQQPLSFVDGGAGKGDDDGSESTGDQAQG